MALTIKQVTNAGLKMTDGTVVPVLRVVLDDGYAGTYTNEETRALMNNIYEMSKGAVTACGYWASGVTADFMPMDTGTEVYGDDTGFKLSVTVNNHYTANIQDYQQVSQTIYYKGDIYAVAAVYTGYSTYETGYFVILTDSDYNLIKPYGGWNSGFQLRTDYNLGVGVYNGDYTVCSVADDGSFNSFEGDWELESTPGDNIKKYISNEINPTENTDPYNPGAGDASGPGGGLGNRDLDSDPIDIPSLPSLSAVDAGFITLFNPTVTQLNNLATYMWSGPFDLATYRKIFADPMDCILGLSIVPVAVPDGGLSNVTVGNVSTGISMTKAASQYVEVDCGSITINEFWGAYLDYEPYTRAELYLPYIGTHPVSIDDIMGKTLTIKYHVDILSGSCTAYVKCGNSVLYEFIGQCGSSIPVTGNDWTNVINGALSIATAIGTMVATGGASAPMTTAQKIGSGVAAGGDIASTAVNTMKPSIEKSGSMSGTGGMLAVQKPYLIITRPRQAVPANQNTYMGYPAFITSLLGSLSGYTVMEEIHLRGISATDDELKEIELLLKGGVIL